MDVFTGIVLGALHCVFAPIKNPAFPGASENKLPKDITNSFLGKVQISPRLGFNYDVKGNQSFVIRGNAEFEVGSL